MLLQSFKAAAEPSYERAWHVQGLRPQRQSVSVIEPQTSCCKRALNTTAAFNQQRPASAAALALNDEQRCNQATNWYVIYSFVLRFKIC